MMNRPIQVIFLLHALAAVSNGGSREYHYFPQSKTWSEAQKYCRENYIDLATVETEEEWSKVQQILQNVNLDPWIGLYDDHTSWRWSLDGTYLYQGSNTPFGTWLPFKSDSWQSNEHCIELYTGQLNDANCAEIQKSICYNEPTNAYFVISTAMNWSEAQSYCRLHYTDLTSVRNKQEKDTIFALIGFYEQYWIGLSRESWKWSDKSTFLFKKWGANEGLNTQFNEFCASAGVTGFIDGNCAVTKPFICAVPVTRRFKVEFTTDSANLDDDVVESLLKSMEGQMNDQKLTLVWEKQANGKRFSRKKDEKYTENSDCA